METQFKKKKKHRGGSYCVAGGPGNISCTNGAYTEGISMHKFPSENRKHIRAQWIRFVQRHRPMWQPSTTSCICSAHFSSDCYTHQFTFGSDESHLRRTLNQDAVPTIDVAGTTSSQADPTPSQCERRKVFMTSF